MKVNLKHSKLFFHIYLFLKRCYSLLGLLFYFCEVKPNKIVFSNFNGKGYGCNPKYISEFLLNNGYSYDLVWLIRKETDVNDFPKKIRLVRYGSIKSMYEMSTAGIWVDNVRKSYFSHKKKNQLYIQTWHGSFRYKKIENDVPELPLFYKKYTRRDARIIDYLLSGSQHTTEIFKKAFPCNGEIIETGYPRTDIFFKRGKSYIEDKTKDKLEISRESKVVLYAPTFRDALDLSIYKLDYATLRKTCVDYFKTGMVTIVLRLHPKIANLSCFLVHDHYVKDASSYPDIQELLVTADMLISDYSGVLFDFLLSRKPAFIYAPDYDDYLAKERGTYISVAELPFPLGKNQFDLFRNVLNFKQDIYNKAIENFQKKYGFYADGKAGERLASLISQHITCSFCKT